MPRMWRTCLRIHYDGKYFTFRKKKSYRLPIIDSSEGSFIFSTESKVLKQGRQRGSVS